MSFDVRPEKQWLTAAEAASEALPGFEYSISQCRRFVSSGEISARPRPGTRGKEFHWTSLPREARAEYLKRYGVTGAGDDDSKAKADSKELRAEARKRIADEARAFIERRGTTIEDGLKSFAKAYKAKKLKLDPWVYGVEPEARPHQVRKWDATIRHKGVGALIDKRGRLPGTSLLDQDDDLRQYVITTHTAQSNWSVARLAKACADDFGRPIAKRTLQRFLKQWKERNKPTYEALINPDAHKSHYQVAFGRRDEDVTHINARWELDATRADCMCLMPDGSERRCVLTMVVDVFTRRAMVLVSDQPRAAATMALLRLAIMSWGVPKLIKTDNGKEFTSQAMERFCADLGIQIKWCQPFHPEQKPYVERMFGTINHGLFPILPSFTGRDIVQRKAIESRKSFGHRFGENAELMLRTTLTPEGLQARVSLWLREMYEKEVHSGIKATPYEVALAHRDDATYLADERVLDALLMEAPDAAGIRTVGSRGIRIANRFYISPELAPRVGYRVHVRHDPHDIGRIVVYNENRTAFICIAEDPDITGANRQIIAVQAHRNQKAYLRTVRDTFRGMQKQFPAKGLADRLLTAAANDSFIPEDEHKKSMELASPTIDAQRQALHALEHHGEPEQAVPPTDEERAYYEERIAELNPPPRPPRMEQCDGYMRPAFIDDDFGFFDWALAHMAAGDALDAQDTAVFDALKRDELFQRLRKQKLQPLSQNAKEVS